jgi:hypothetical protein
MLPLRETVASIVLLLACASCREGRHSEQAEGYRDRFSVDPGSLKSEGTSTFFPLVPGTVRVYRDEDETVTITVLAETRVVDGVTTRVIEEREEEDGKLKEVSRNFFAIDPATGDVYYFGEEVDIYKKGVIASHGGAWLSGVDGARFGLIMPGRPVVGDRHYQEIAPGVAMDRAEVASLDEKVETPAGVFEHCLHVRETSPLEKGVSDKWYAPGFGLIRDEDCALVSR